MKNCFLLIFIVAFFLGCKKGQADFVVKGTLTDATTNQPISNATITVFKKMALSAAQNVLQVVKTNAEGKYELVVKRDQFEFIRMVVEKDMYFSLDKTINLDELTLKDDNTIDLTTTGKSWVGIRLKHNESQNTKFNIITVEGKKDCEECCPSGYKQFTGILDTTIYCINDANTLYKVTYYVTGGGALGDKSVTTSFGDTTYMQIVY